MVILVITRPVALVRGLHFGIGNVATMGTIRPVHRTEIPVLFPTQRTALGRYVYRATNIVTSGMVAIYRVCHCSHRSDIEKQ
jgi:hypothetical protein